MELFEGHHHYANEAMNEVPEVLTKSPRDNTWHEVDIMRSPTRPSRRSSTWRTRKDLLPLYTKFVMSKECNDPRGILVICES